MLYKTSIIQNEKNVVTSLPRKHMLEFVTPWVFREIPKKASKKLYFLVQLKRARGLPASDLVLFYLSCVRSTVDYAKSVFHHALPQYLNNELMLIKGVFDNFSQHELQLPANFWT